MIRKAIITKKPDGIACQDIESTGSSKSTGSAGLQGRSAGLIIRPRPDQDKIH